MNNGELQNSCQKYSKIGEFSTYGVWEGWARGNEVLNKIEKFQTIKIKDYYFISYYHEITL